MYSSRESSYATVLMVPYGYTLHCLWLVLCAKAWGNTILGRGRNEDMGLIDMKHDTKELEFGQNALGFTKFG
jgi:hypothetical protein